MYEVSECTWCLARRHRAWQCVSDTVCRQCRTSGHRIDDGVWAALAGDHQPETTIEGSEGNHQADEVTDSRDRFTWKEIGWDPLTDDMTSDDGAADEGDEKDRESATGEIEPPLGLHSRQSRPQQSKSTADTPQLRGKQVLKNKTDEIYKAVKVNL